MSAIAATATAGADSGSGRDNELNVDNASRGVWLVKVPKYMAEKWSHAKPMAEIGRLKISKNVTGKPQILFEVDDEIIKTPSPSSSSTSSPATPNGTASGSGGKSGNIAMNAIGGLKHLGADRQGPLEMPKEHRFTISDIPHQHLAIFSQTKGENGRTKLMLEGNVQQKGECQPIASARYMELKRDSIRKAHQPTREVKQLNHVVNAFKPVSTHVEITKRKEKSLEGKKARDDLQVVQEKLFEAFEKHQYYSFKDLVGITKQPVPYLKSILKDLCKQNTKGNHKHLYELKDEYRHYNSAS